MNVFVHEDAGARREIEPFDKLMLPHNPIARYHTLNLEHGNVLSIRSYFSSIRAYHLSAKFCRPMFS
jgi:hypothetical protein